MHISQAFFAYTNPPSTNNPMSDELTFKLLGTSLKCSAPPRTKSENPSVDDVPEPQEKIPACLRLTGVSRENEMCWQ